MLLYLCALDMVRAKARQPLEARLITFALRIR